MFLATLSEMAERFEIKVFAYVLMSNHYHLLVQTRLAKGQIDPDVIASGVANSSIWFYYE